LQASGAVLTRRGRPRSPRRHGPVDERRMPPSVSASINASIAGDKTQRATAYAALTALAHGDNVDITATLASASVHISGALGQAELDNEGRLAEAFGQFGSVLAVTLHRDDASCWALLTFDQAEEAQAAVAGGASAERLGGVTGLVVRALDTQQALGEAGGMGEAAREHRERVSVGVALPCVGPLMETVFAADVSVVDAEEYRHAASALAELIMVDVVQLCAEYLRNERFAITWLATGNAYHAVFQKDPAELTRDDALTVAWDAAVGPGTHLHGTGFDAGLGPAGIEFYDWMKVWIEHDMLGLNSSKATDAFLRSLTTLFLELVSDPKDLSELAQVRRKTPFMQPFLS
jgi:hypothetical protein